jgi:asparaginyl-tRNA synthetase
MPVISLKDAKQHLGQNVEIRGWSHNVRSSGSIAFLQLRDGSGRIQAVVSKAEVSPESWAAATEATIESSVIVTGTLKEEPRSPSGVELQATHVKLIQKAEEYPIGKKEHGPDFLLNNRHLWVRSARQEAILRVRDEIEFGFREFMKLRGFTLTDSPIFTPSACEGTTELFEVKYFEDKAYLSQSGQLYSEATAMSLGKVYDFGPVFRSEKSKTRRHLTEFWMLDAEAAFMDWQENMQLQEDLVVHTVKRVLRECTADLKTLERDVTKLEKVAEGGFPRLHYREALAQVQKLGSDMKDGDDFGADDETVLTKQYDKPIFVHHYPVGIKAFYMKPDPNEPQYALNSDLLAPEGYGEVIGGSERIADLAFLEQRIYEHKLPKEAFEWYLDLRRFGSVPHSGFGIGLERTVAWLCGLEHVRETIPFPRLMNRLTP